MTTTAERLRTYWSERAFDPQRVVSLAARYWEIGLYVGLVGLALGLRLWNLDVRAYHHDEGIHSWYSWHLAEGRGYEHNPTYHGPFHIAVTAALFVVFGDNDFTGRLLPALFGTALVAMPFFLRGFLGRTGALIASLLIALSPVLLYLSRFSHYDVHIAVFTLGLVIIVWRYMKEQKEVYLYGIPLLLMLGFATKEVTFITTAILVVYLEVRLAMDLVDELRASRSMRTQETALAYTVLLPTAWLLAALWPLLEAPRKRWSLSTLPPSGHLMVITGTFALPQFAAAIQKLSIGALSDGGYMGERTLMMVSVFLAIIATAYVGLLWNPRVWAISAAIFYVPYFLLYTTFFTNGGDVWNVTGTFWEGRGGFWTGIWGSLDYWLQQQFERRGNQPDYYYFMFLPVYEFLPLVFALGGTLYYAFRGRLEHKLLAAAALLLVLAFSLMPDDFAVVGGWRIQLSFVVAIGTVLLLPMESFTKFLVFWTLSILFALTVAGEKMPWLAAHLALPLALLAAKVLDDVLSSVGRQTKAAAPQEEPQRGRSRRPQRAKAAAQQAKKEQGLALEPLLPLVLGGVLALAAAAIFQGVGPASGSSVVPWLLATAALGAVLWAGRSVSWQAAGQTAAVALFAALLVFTIRAGGYAAYDQGDRGSYPPELLIYAQGSPDLGAIRDEIVELGRTSGRGSDLRIVHQSGVNDWPWPWYLRDYNYGYHDFATDFVPESGSVALISQENKAQVERYIDKVERSEEYTHMWWFPERYRGLEPAGFLGDFFRGNFISLWRRYFIDRELPGATSAADRIVYYFRDEPIIERPAAKPQTEGVVDANRQTLFGGPGTGEGQFNQPADLALDAGGNVYVVDTLNHRVQKLGPDGRFLDSAGRTGGGEGEFADPSAGDSQFAADGPWGIEVDREGNIYVADTWNHRIQKFAPDLEFVREWGAGELFGPRDIAIGPDGSVLVVDTGNKRIVKYTAEGEFVEAYGGAGRGPSQFEEPSSISVAPTGDIYVADFWNRRVQHFDRNFKYVSEFRVETWGSHGITDRAYIAVLGDGAVLATDPANGQVLVFDASGKWLAAWRLVPSEEASRPVGIVVAGDQVYIGDSLTAQVRRVPLSVLLAQGAQ